MLVLRFGKTALFLAAIAAAQPSAHNEYIDDTSLERTEGEIGHRLLLNVRSSNSSADPPGDDSASQKPENFDRALDSEENHNSEEYFYNEDNDIYDYDDYYGENDDDEDLFEDDTDEVEFEYQQSNEEDDDFSDETKMAMGRKTRFKRKGILRGGGISRGAYSHNRRGGNSEDPYGRRRDQAGPDYYEGRGSMGQSVSGPMGVPDSNNAYKGPPVIVNTKRKLTKKIKLDIVKYSLKYSPEEAVNVFEDRVGRKLTVERIKKLIERYQTKKAKKQRKQKQ